MGDRDQSATPSVIARTDRWLVLLKPPGWLTVPGRSPGVPVLSEWAGREGRVWTVHRLDLETSGVVLFARDPESHRDASDWFGRHRVRKAYDFLASGRMSTPVTRVSLAVEGSHSVTQIEVRRAYPGSFLGRAVPLTGRRHQIRVHLSAQGCPLLGDHRYGGPMERALGEGNGLLRIERMALHARRLELPSKEVFEAPWPEDFTAWVAALEEAADKERRGSRGADAV